jgi:nitroreductase
MDVKEAIRSRRSIRAYLDKAVEPDKLEAVLEAARLAPSASNQQLWKFIVVQSKELREKLGEACNRQAFVGEAPAIIVACSAHPERRMSCGQLPGPVDLSIAVDHMTLRAVELGLGTCWIGAFQEPEVKKILGIPENIRVITVLPLGYPKTLPKPTSRKKLKEIVAWEKWEG